MGVGGTGLTDLAQDLATVSMNLLVHKMRAIS
jgi:hypothetical protein